MSKKKLDIAVEFMKFTWNYLVVPAVIMVMNVPDEVAGIKVDVKGVRARSREAYRKAAEAEDGDTRDRMERRASQLREVAFHMEDVIDEYKNKCEVQQPCCYPGCGALPCHDADFVNTTCYHRLQIALKIKCIQSELLKIDKMIEKEDNKVKSSSAAQEQRRRSHSTVIRNDWESLRKEAIYMPLDDIVGFEGHCDKLISWLEMNQPQCTVFALVGMGGRGKTTLARKIFNDKEAMEKFDCKAWINVSQFQTPEELFKDVLRQVCEQTKESPPQGIVTIKEVKTLLKKNRYVLFFDEVWEHNFWKEIMIREFVGCNNDGSRIIITTRNLEIAQACKGSAHVEVHEMQPLTIEESLKLFHQTAFRYDDDGSSKKICGEIMPAKIVEECKGLPLAIVAIGKLVAVKPELAYKWKINIENAGITKILSLSFDDLDDSLKSCFMYFGMYPHKDEVKSKRLIRQWISEGFLKSEEGTLVEEEETLEDVAAEYLDVLIKKNLVQVSSFTIDGKPKSCHVHYLIHDMILRQFKDFGFCRRISEDVQSHTREIARRLSIATNCSEDLPGFFDDLTRSVESKFIQSVLLFTKEVVLTAEFVESIPKTYPLLQVLDFENAQLSCVQDLRDLTYLKYLSFRNTQIQSLPKSIGKLHNLETLDIRQTAVKEIPKEVCKLTKLRHLLGKDMSLVQLKDGIGGMKSLQTLRHVKLDGSGTELITELGKLWHLRDLRLTNVGGEHGSHLCSSINKMKHLTKLHIVAKPGNEAIDLLNLKEHSKLPKLRLQGRFQLPEWVLRLSDNNLVLSSDESEG